MSVVDGGYWKPARPWLGMEVLRYPDLVKRLPGAEFRRVHRVAFHQLVLVHRGVGTAMVDFVDIPCRPATLLHTRPGQVQRLPADAYGRPAVLDATVVMFAPDFPLASPEVLRDTADPHAPAGRRVDPDTYDRLRAVLDDLAAEYAGSRTPEADRELLRLLTTGLLLRITRLPAPPTRAGGRAYRLFHHELEEGYALSRQASDYADRIGCSLRTLNRACRRATGHTAKDLIDARVTLEAKRLLAHTALSVVDISHRLGFNDPAYFNKFFTREAGRTPGAFRVTQR